MAIFRLNYLNQVQIAANTLSRNRAKSIIQRFLKVKVKDKVKVNVLSRRAASGGAGGENCTLLHGFVRSLEDLQVTSEF